MKGSRNGTKRVRFLDAVTSIALSLQAFVQPVTAAEENEHLFSVDYQEIQDVYDLPEQFPADDFSVIAHTQSNTSVRALVRFKDDALASKVDTEKFDPADETILAMRADIARKQDERITQIEKSVLQGKTLDVRVRLDLAINAISVQASPSVLSKIAKLDFVESVEEEKEVLPLETREGVEVHTTEIGGANEAASGAGSLPEGLNGQGSRIAVIDTGLNVEHIAFNNSSYLKLLSDKAAAANMSIEAYKTRLDLLEESDIAQVKSSLHLKTGDSSLSTSSLHYSEKVPFRYNYADGGAEVGHTSDGAGDHGTHVAGIAAANTLVPSGDSFTNAKDMCGYAPGAQILVMKVYGRSASGSESDLFAAMEDAVTLGSNAINLSLSTSEAGYADPQDGTFREFLDSLAGFDTVITCSSSNSGSWPDETRLEGKLKNGDVSFQTSGSPGTYSHVLSIASSDPYTYKAPADSNAHELSGQMEISAFSSWGMTETLELKPELTAPGSSIRSANGMTNSQYNIRSGTSMSAPAAAGMSAVLSSYIEEQGLAEKTGYSSRFLMHSLLMSTALPLKDGEDRYYPVFAQGAGEARIDRAVQADLVLEMDSRATSEAADGKIKAELKDDPDRTGSYSFTIKMRPIEEQQYVTFEKHFFTQEVDADGNLLKITRPLELNAADEDGKVYIVPAGRKSSQTFHIELSEAEKTRLREESPKGAYIEGYVSIRICEVQNGTAYPKAGAVSYSVPVLGFFGDWNEPSVFENISLAASAKPSGQTVQAYTLDREADGRYHTNMLKVASRLSASNQKSPRYLAGNPYLIDESDDLARSAINSDQTFESLTLSTVRNPAFLRMGVQNEDGTIANYDNKFYYGAFARKPYTVRNSTSVYWYDSTHLFAFDSADLTQNLSAGQTYTFNAFAPIEYAGITDAASFDDYVLSEQFLDSQKLSFPFVIDDEKPELVSVSASGNSLHVRTADNRYTAVAALLSDDGSQVLASAIPQGSAAGEQASASLDVSSLTAGDYVLVLGDYARNERAYRLHVTEKAEIAWNLTRITADAGQSGENGDLTFTLSCEENYVLPDQITLLRGTSIVSASGYRYSKNTDGRTATLVLKASLLDEGGKLTIRASANRLRTKMTFALRGEGLTLSASEIALPFTGTTYTLKLQAGRGMELPAAVSIERDGSALSADSYSYLAGTEEIVFQASAFEDGDTLTIVADAIRPHKPVTVSCMIEEIETEDAALTTWTDAVIQLQKSGASLLYPETVTLRNGDVTLEANVFSYDAQSGRITIPAESLIEDTLVISGTARHDVRDMAFENALQGTEARFVQPKTWTDWQADFTPLAWTKLPQTIRVSIDGKALSASDYIWKAEQGRLQIGAERMRGSSVKVEGVVDMMDMTFTSELNGLHFNQTPTSWKTHTGYQLSLVADTGFSLPETVDILIDGTEKTEGFSWNAQTGRLIIEADTMQGAALTIRADGALDHSDMEATFDLDAHISMNPRTPTVKNNTELTLNFVADPDFHLPASVNILVDNEPCRTFTWDAASGSLSVPADALRGHSFALSMHSVADGATEVILDSSVFGSIVMTGDPVNGEAFSFTLEPDEGYLLPSSVDLFYGESKRPLAADTEYTYDARTGIIVLSASVVDGAQIHVTASMIKEADFSQLRLVIETIEALEGSQYSGSALESLLTQAAEARSLLDVRQDQTVINSNAADLNARLLALRKAPSKDALEAIYQQ